MPAIDRWSDWIDEHGPRLLLFARQQARAEGGVGAEDILQEALVRLWKRLGEAPPLGFAFREIRRVAIDSARAHDRRKRREQKSTAAVDNDWFSPHSAALVPDDARSLLAKIPREQAEVVVLKIWGGLSFREIAEATECPTATASGRYRLAMEKLRHSLDGDDPDTQPDALASPA